MFRAARRHFLTLAAFLTSLTLLTLLASSCVHPPPPTPPLPQPVPRAQQTTGEIRGVWLHDPRGLNWDYVARDLASARFNTVFVKFSTGGAAYYPSGVYSMSGARRDEVTRCFATMRRYGISVHAWHVNLQMKDAPLAEIRHAIAENRVQRDPSGRVLYPSYKNTPILCPSSAANRALEVRAMVELAQMGFDGVQLDHIRFADGDSCYCANCRAGFEQQIGRRAQWPREVVEGGNLRPQFIAYKQSVVTRLVYEIRRGLNETGRKVFLSAAVFPELATARSIRGQDWKAWVDGQYIDMLCPMNYVTSTAAFTSRLQSEMSLVGGRVPVAVGLGAYMDSYTPRMLQEQITVVQRAGARGFIIFNYDASFSRKFLPSLR